jgi:hypothetical protein
VARSGNHSICRRGQRIYSRGRGAQGGLHLPEDPVDAPRGTGVGAAASGDGEFRAPPRARPLRVRAPEVPEAVRFASSCLGAPMRRGPPALGVHRAGIFTLFPLPVGRPRRLALELGPAAVTETEGSISLVA